MKKILACAAIHFCVAGTGFAFHPHPIRGKWSGVYESEVVELEFMKDAKACTKFRNKEACFNYLFLNDSLLQIGTGIHRVEVLNDSLLQLRPVKVQKDIALLDVVLFRKIR